MKNEHFRAFDRSFFAKHQRVLLWLLNSRLSRRWFRWVLCIRPHDARLEDRIVRIEPNNYKVLVSGTAEVLTLRADFRTHWKYSKRLYNSFKYVWWTLHFWDWLFADRFVPRLSFGFITLTVFPDPENETATVDGTVRESVATSTWATLTGGAGTEARDDLASDDVIRIIASTTSGKWNDLWRSIFLFDTSSLGPAAIITNVAMSVYGSNKTDPASFAPNTDVYTSNPASNTALVPADYSTLGSTSQTGSPRTYANWSITGYNDYTFNSTGRGNVSLTAISKFGLRNVNYDVAASAPTWSSGGDSETIGYMADQSGTSNDPKLVVTYGLNHALANGNITALGSSGELFN